MKNKILLVLSGILLIAFIAVGTYAWYVYFLETGRGYSITTAPGTRIGDVVLIDNGKNVYDTEATNTNDSDVDKITPYKFKVSNLGNTNRVYTLYIEDLPLNSINDGCSSKTLLKRSQLKYQLKVNDKVVKEDYLSNIKDNILDKRSVNGKDSNAYELRIYIHDETEEWNNKHYHYQVVLKKVD